METLVSELESVKNKMKNEIFFNLTNGGIIKGKYELPDYGSITPRGDYGIEDLDYLEVWESEHGVSTIFFITDNSKVDLDDLTTDDLVYFYEWVISDDVQITFIRV